MRRKRLLWQLYPSYLAITSLSLLAVGAVTGLGWLVLELLRSSFSLPLKTILGALLLGLVLMVAMAIRARLKTLPYDPYREVQR